MAVHWNWVDLGFCWACGHRLDREHGNVRHGNQHRKEVDPETSKFGEQFKDHNADKRYVE